KLRWSFLSLRARAEAWILRGAPARGDFAPQAPERRRASGTARGIVGRTCQKLVARCAGRRAGSGAPALATTLAARIQPEPCLSARCRRAAGFAVSAVLATPHSAYAGANRANAQCPP